jgi:hypothetical protein
MWFVSALEIYCASSQTKALNDCDATVLRNDCSYLVFVGNGWLPLVPSYLPHLEKLCLTGCHNVRDVYVEVLMASLPELKVIR